MESKLIVLNRDFKSSRACGNDKFDYCRSHPGKELGEEHNILHLSPYSFSVLVEYIQFRCGGNFL